MVKNNQKLKAHDPLKTWIVEKVAEIHGVHERYVYMVIEGSRNNDKILGSYLSIKEGATTSAMIEAVTALVPFETTNPAA